MKTIEEIETQIVELQKELELLKNPPSYKRWRAEKGEIYYAIDWGLAVQIREEYYDANKYNYNIGNYYKTGKEAEYAYSMKTAIVRVNDRIDELNEGWEHNNEKDRYWIFFGRNMYGVNYFSLNGYICPSILNFCKTKEIAEKIIEENKEDLDLIFNLK